MSTQYNSNLVNVQAPFKLIPPQEILKVDKYIDGDAFFQQIYPQNQLLIYELQRQATFWLDSPNCALDIVELSIRMDIKTVAVGNTGFVDNDAHCLFARVRLLTKSGVVFEDVIRSILNISLKKCVRLDKSSVTVIGKTALIIHS